MKLTKCNNNHYYDSDKYSQCPHCSGAVKSANEETIGFDQDDGKTFVLDNTTANDETQSIDITTPLTQSIAPAVPTPPVPPVSPVQPVIPFTTPGATQELKDESKTLVLDPMFEVPPVVGWLVCVEGPHFGEDFRLKQGVNHIGRSLSMDVQLTNDNTVSREKHAVVVFEPKEGMFLAHQGDSKTLFYLNGKVVLQVEQLKAGDILELGDSKLLFVPLCSNNFKWADYVDNTKSSKEPVTAQM